MNWTRTLLDGAAMAAVFNLTACVLMLLSPRYMMGSYPKAILKAAPQPQTAREKCVGNGSMSLAFLLLLLYGVASAAQAGVRGFWPLFRVGYTQWLMVSLTDFFLLDVVLFEVMKPRLMIPGTENHPGYGIKSWLVKLALPEHLLLWPLVVAPLLAAVQAAAGAIG
ncbi:MAG: hypothetical protein PHO10_04620 [Gemmiger sp.]|nr:hypothetical protein [Gemmiger sp.]